MCADSFASRLAHHLHKGRRMRIHLLLLCGLLLSCVPDVEAEPEALASISEATFEDACSVPVPAEWLVLRSSTLFVLNPGKIFAESCNRHDNCYHSGLATYGKTRSQCDR